MNIVFVYCQFVGFVYRMETREWTEPSTFHFDGPEQIVYL